MKAIKIDKRGNVLVDTDKGFNVWIDVWKENDELMADWNAYIFILDNEKDIEIKAFQEDCNNFEEATNVAISFYKIKARLKYLRAELRAERISYGEIAELQSLVDYIDSDDVELLQAAGVSEQ